MPTMLNSRSIPLSIGLISLFSALPIYADTTDASATPATKTENDTIPYEEDPSVTDLIEIVVQGRSQRNVKYGVEYTPDKKTKRAALDATSLLQLMAIPQLVVQPGSTAVSMTGGREVKMFIDFQPATEQDLIGMRPEDVQRVEVLEYPQDPRFQGAQYVVNYIMQRYEWGGYTKASGGLTPLSYIDGYGALYSKFTYKDWTFDANAGAAGSRNDKESSFRKEIMRDFNFADRHIDYLERTSSTTNSLNERNSQWGSLRAVYSVKDIYVSHTFSFNRTATPVHHNSSTVDFSGNLLPSTESFSSENSSSILPSILANYYFVLPRGNSITVYWDFSYGRNNRNSSYRLGSLDPIINNNRESIYAPNATLEYSKSLNHQNTIRTSLMTYNSIFDTRYDGSYTDRQKLLSSENMFFLEYMQNWNFGLSLYSRAGMSYVMARVNGINTLNQWNPRLGLQLRYRINNHHAASVSGWWGNSHPGPDASNTALVRQSELLWLQGNPDLHNTLFQLIGLSYDYIPTDRLSLSLYAQYEGNPQKQAFEFMTIPGYDGLVRRTVNSGSAHDWQFNLSGSLRLFDNSLTLKAAVMADHIILTGIDARKLNDFRANVSANYFFGNFTFSGYYYSPAKHLGGWSRGVCSTERSRYGVEVGYSNGNFKATLSCANWWNSNRVYTDFKSDHLTSTGWNWNSDTALNLRLSLSYTLSYGKKVNQGDEVGTKGSVGSAILK